MDISYIDTFQKTIKKPIGGKFSLEVETEGFLDSSNQIILHKELFWEATSSTRLLYTNTTDIIDFRYVEFERRSEPFVITVINNSNEKMLMKWVLDNNNITNNNQNTGTNNNQLMKLKKNYKEKMMKQYKEANKHSVQQFLNSNNEIIKVNSVFSVVPEEIIVNKRGSYDFKVFFNPIKPEYYFFAQLTCLGILLNQNLLGTNNIDLSNNSNNMNQLKSLKGLISNSALNLINNPNKSLKENNVSKLSKTNNSKINNLLISSSSGLGENSSKQPIMDPPIPLKISVVGHSFPPSTQIYIPMAEVEPKNEVNFPYSSLNQSQFSSFRIKNTTDTPLFFKFITDTSHVFKVHPKCGLIEPKQFLLVCAEFCPKETKIYKFPLKIIFNHDNNNMYNLLLQGACLDPKLEINDGKKDIYFSPSFVNISTKKTISIVNRAPIKVNCEIKILEIKQIKKKKKNVEILDPNASMNMNNNTNNNTNIMTLNKSHNNDETQIKNLNEITNNEINNNSNLKNSQVLRMPLSLKNAPQTSHNKNATLSYSKRISSDYNNMSIFNKEKEINDNKEFNNSEDMIEEEEEEDYLNPASIRVEPNYFDLEGNQNRHIDLHLIPLEKCNFEIKIQIISGRIYDPSTEALGVFNPGCLNAYMKQDYHQAHDRRETSQILQVIGSGADGVLRVDPLTLDFGTVKVGFQEKKTFSIYNTSLCNFYVQLQFPEDNAELYQSIFQFDFKEGLIHSLCKKTISITYKPNTRFHVDFKIIIYAVEHKESEQMSSFNKTKMNLMLMSTDDKNNTKTSNYNNNINNVSVLNKVEKASINIIANGNYPLIRIVDVRNNMKSTTTLWKNLNCDDANYELSKELSEEEINFINSEKANKKIQDFYEKLKCIKFNFGKHLLKKVDKNSNNKNQKLEVFLTFKNEGGVDSEFFFKFPDDISIKREIWMDPDEPTSEGTREYHVLKHKIFEVEPRRFKLKKNECCNIKFTYNIQEKNEHSLRVIFQIVNGKPLVFELYAETHYEKEGILLIKNPELDFSSIPMGNMTPMTSIIEIQNIGGIKLKYALDESIIDEYNSQFEGFPIFKVENAEGGLGAGDVKHLIVYFKPLTTMLYNLVIPVDFYDDVNLTHKKLFIKLSGTGYHPLETVYTAEEDKQNFLKDLVKLPKNIIYNNFDNKIIYKCGLSIDEINFGIVENGKQSVQTFILFNYSSYDTLEYEIKNQGFSLNDEIKFYPDSGKLEPNSHIIIKATLFCKSRMLTYIGEAQVKILWKKEEFKENFASQIFVERQELHLRIIKRAMIKETMSAEGKLESNLPQNTCFVEHILDEFFKDIICNDSFDEHLTNNMDNQPLKLYQWTTNIPSNSHAQVRKQFLDNSINRVRNEGGIFIGTSMKKTTKMTKDKVEIHNINSASKSSMAKDEIDLEDKYTKELVSKFGYSNNEMDEKLLMVNEDTKKLVFDILENTVYNIICEAVYGECDLSEPTKIFFIKK